ncbi:putative colanic acid biosynthesis acetyltransferase [Bradyrhizobium guangzhouense]|uniref:Colanic acid biosynthesis acetyltransferase n=1 Tax=Bradyrhizobium guangzhouense TaxID=1325095 RepID=A0AAE6CAE4_9BRAD|nr:putative colanic acid biosynthesis acetyltransferase [Bradyrhizobium guangzhouense]QAU48743.1 putative colanic acid biosynthesis acetyltransferase [Bradyrhizobium guangzhouense]
MAILEASVSNPLTGGPSFSLRNRLIRLLWNATWLLLASWTPPFMHSWRRFLLRLFGARVAATSGIYGSARIWYPANFEIGEHAYVGPRAIIYSMAKITLGDYSLVSQGAHLCAGSHDIDDPNFQLRAKPITVSARAWIAAEAFVGPGVCIGEGAVLGARACAFRDLSPWTVYAGNPAQELRRRKTRT